MSRVDVATHGVIRASAAATRTIGRRAWTESLQLALGARAVAFGIAIAASWFLIPDGASAPAGIFDMWRRWDAEHFLTIAEHGYTAPESDRHAAAFFPAFPLVVRALLVTGLTPVAAGMLVSLVAAVVAGAILYRLVEEEIGLGAGRRALLYLTVFPTTVFLIAPYSESLFLAGAIGAFYLARRGRWHLVGIPAAVAMGARAAGVFLLIGLALEYVRQGRFSRHRNATVAVALVIGALPLLAYGAFLAQAMGDPFAFLEHQREGWGRTYVGPISSFMNTWNTWDPAAYPTSWLLSWRLEIVAAAVGVAFTGWAVAKREWGYAGFMGSMLLVLMTSTWYYSIPRMLLTMFPIVIFLSEATTRRKQLHEWLIIGFAPLAALGIVIFTEGAWFY